MPYLVVAALALAGCQDAQTRTDAAFSRTGELVTLSGGDGGAANACFSCHGLDGGGDGQATPRLAGLDAGYLAKQMEDYATGLRTHALMEPIARGLSPGARLKVAAYYAALPAPVPPTPVRTDPPPAAWLACATCHGDQGQGAGQGGPGLAGQPAPYLAEQMNLWRRAERRNDPRGVMRLAVATLDDADVVAISAWLAGQSTAPRPGSAGAMEWGGGAAREAPAP